MPKYISDLPAGTLSTTSQMEMQNGADGQKFTGQELVDFVEVNIPATIALIQSIPLTAALTYTFTAIPGTYSVLLFRFAMRNGGAVGNITISMSTDGTTYGGAASVFGSNMGANNYAVGQVQVIGYSDTITSCPTEVIARAENGVTGTGFASLNKGGGSGAVTDFRATFGAAPASGTLELYGMK